MRRSAIIIQKLWSMRRDGLKQAETVRSHKSALIIQRRWREYREKRDRRQASAREIPRLRFRYSLKNQHTFTGEDPQIYDCLGIQFYLLLCFTNEH